MHIAFTLPTLGPRTRIGNFHHVQSLYSCAPYVARVGPVNCAKNGWPKRVAVAVFYIVLRSIEEEIDGDPERAGILRSDVFAYFLSLATLMFLTSYFPNQAIGYALVRVHAPQQPHD